MLALTLLDPARYRRVPWKNGGGVTIDVAGAVRSGAQPGDWGATIWRFGSTRIVEPAPFSDLAGFDRLLAVVDGRGLVLRPSGRAPIDVREPFRPVRFPGEWPIESALEAGPVGVINLMADRTCASIDLQFAVGARPMRVAPGLVVLYAAAGLAEIALDGRAVPLASTAAVQVETAAPLDVTVQSGVVAVASIRLLPAPSSG